MAYSQMRRIEEMHKDQIDEYILEFLRNDSRKSFVEFGKNSNFQNLPLDIGLKI